MKRGRVSAIVFMVLLCSSLFAQAPQEKPLPPAEVVRRWFALWNALDGSDEATNKLLELYRPDANHEIPPTDRQLGPVRFQGHAQIRKMIDDFAKANTEITFRIQPVTANEKTTEIIHMGEGPWGGTSTAVRYAAAYTTRKDHRRWMYPGAAFFEIQNGKIRSARFYMSYGEVMEVFNR